MELGICPSGHMPVHSVHQAHSYPCLQFHQQQFDMALANAQLS